MNPDALLRLSLFVGHAAALVLAINVVHGLGLTERRMDRVKALLIATALFLFGGWAAVAFSQGGWNARSWPVQGYALLCLAIAFIGLPVSTIVRVCRREPEGILERNEEEIDLAAIHGAESLIGDGRYSWLLRIPGNASFRLRLREWDVPIAGLPDAWDGLSMIQLTDLHFAPCFRRRFFDLVADHAAAAEADLVLFTGDLLDHDQALEWIVPVLSRLRGRLGTYGILGNHDYNHEPGRILGLMEQAGFTNLEGRWARIEVEGRSLAIGGTCAPWGPRLDLGSQPDADFRLLLSHSPDQYYRAARAGIDLMLSGHNHGGQIRVPVLGPILMPSLYSRRFDRGFFRSGKTLMHVSQGVAGKHPIRIGCVPEIGRFVLRATREATAHEDRPRTLRAPHGNPFAFPRARARRDPA